MIDLERRKTVWEECISLALEAYNAGSMGIAAVIVDKNGVVARGRNQLKDGLKSCNAIKMTSIAHAEINALNNIPPERQKDKNLTLYTTVEPCPMCLGAIAMSRIRRIVIGSADPYAGSIRLIEKDEYLKQKGISVVFEHGKVEELCFALHYISLKRVLKPHHAIFNRLQNRYLSYTKKMDELIDSSRLILGSEQIRKSRLMAVLGY